MTYHPSKSHDMRVEHGLSSLQFCLNSPDGANTANINTLDRHTEQISIAR